jgi:hypothetical protein
VEKEEMFPPIFYMYALFFLTFLCFYGFLMLSFEILANFLQVALLAFGGACQAGVASVQYEPVVSLGDNLVG